MGNNQAVVASEEAGDEWIEQRMNVPASYSIPHIQQSCI